eukprot:GGOE01062023.1.p1 GENE.GGOE01062023.1~~GGOE01062023.1.p1  ORF type:complete len:558 (+),score=79.89 GGOE01062023.1:61-1734(+)
MDAHREVDAEVGITDAPAGERPPVDENSGETGGPSSVSQTKPATPSVDPEQCSKDALAHSTEDKVQLVAEGEGHAGRKRMRRFTTGNFQLLRRSPRLRDTPEAPQQPKYIAPPCGPQPLYSVDDQDMFAQWEGRWYPITILANSTRKEGLQWMYDVRWDGYTGPDGDASQNDSSYPEAWIWHRSFVPRLEIVPWARPRDGDEKLHGRTGNKPARKATIPKKPSTAAGRLRRQNPGAAESPDSKVGPVEDCPKRPKWEDDEYQPEEPGRSKRAKTAEDSDTTAASKELRRSAKPSQTQAKPPPKGRQANSAAAKRSGAVGKRRHTSSSGKDQAVKAEAVVAPRLYIGPECGRRPAYKPGRKQELMALWRNVWYPVVILKESIAKVDGQWMYSILWLENPKAQTAEVERDESDYPEGWIWERRHVPLKHMVPWARQQSVAQQALGLVLAELRRSKKRGFDHVADTAPAPDPPTARERALAENKLGWQPVVHPSQLSIGMDVRLMLEPISGYIYDVRECLGACGKVCGVQGYPPVQVKFETGTSYWCDYQDLEFLGVQDW